MLKDKSKKVENKGFRENFDYKYEATRPPSQSQLKPALRYYSITFFEIAAQDNYVAAEKMRNTYLGLSMNHEKLLAVFGNTTRITRNKWTSSKACVHHRFRAVPQNRKEPLQQHSVVVHDTAVEDYLHSHQ